MGAIHAYRCPRRRHFCRLYSRCKVCMVSRTGVRSRKVKCGHRMNNALTGGHLFVSTRLCHAVGVCRHSGGRPSIVI